MTTEPTAPSRNRLRIFSMIELALIVGMALVPLFLTFPYRVNIFLSWEGAYRMSLGQIPYRDFGMPMGYMYWVIPALFFKVFGPALITLVKAQVLINILSGLAFRSILKSLGVQPGLRLIGVLVYVLSYSFFNFWPWYNHTVIVYEFLGLAFLLRYLLRERPHWTQLVMAALFLFCSFFTKQDGGGMALLIALALLIYAAILDRTWKPLAIFIASYVAVACLFILPLQPYNFGYWFNHGQPPHTARFSAFEIVEEFFGASQWIKFYLFLILLIGIAHFRRWIDLRSDKRTGLFLLLTLGILAEAAILQVTSYTPPDNNIFFHAFAIVFLLSILLPRLKLDLFHGKNLVVASLGVLLWWSGITWRYFARMAQKLLPAADMATTSPQGENIVNRRTYMIFPAGQDIPTSEWTFSSLPAFRKIYMPRPTAEGIDRLLRIPGVRNNPKLRVLNMSELTPLAAELPFTLETSPQTPLWYHLGVSMFNREAQMYENRIRNHEYDLVLFEYIPTLNNFYPFRVRDTLMKHYQKIDSFYAPRRGPETMGMVEVYRRE
jgi:hypothetical protein